MDVLALPHPDRRPANSFSIAHLAEPTDFEELMAGFRCVAEGRDGRCFITLDSVEQCLYTSLHARQRHGLEAPEGFPDDDSPEAIAAFDLSNFRHAQQALRDPRKAVPYTQLAGQLQVAAAPETLAAINRDLDVLLEEVHVVQLLPTNEALDLLADLPNGYFQGGLDPFQLWALATRMAKHGYELFGIGSCTVGFARTTAPTPTLIADLSLVYGKPESPAWDELLTVLTVSPYLVLGFTSDFDQLLE